MCVCDSSVGPEAETSSRVRISHISSTDGLGMDLSNESYLCLQWNEFETNLGTSLRHLRDQKCFFDVTIACEEGQIRAHKIVLSSSSLLFQKILCNNPYEHSLLFLKGARMKELNSVVDFMYCGEVNIEQSRLNDFLATAEDLQVKGLMYCEAGNRDKGGNTLKPKRSAEGGGGKGPPPKKIKPKPHHQQNHLNSNNHHPQKQQKESQHNNASSPDDGTNNSQNMDDDMDDDDYIVIPTKVELNEGEPDESIIATDDSGLASAGGDVGGGGGGIPNDFDLEEVSNHLTPHMLDDTDPNSKLLVITNLREQLESNGLDMTSSNEDKHQFIKEIMKQYMTFQANGTYSCKLCFKITKNRTHMQEHLEAKHIQEALYACEGCGKSLSSSASHRLHKKRCMVANANAAAAAAAAATAAAPVVAAPVVAAAAPVEQI